jgi:MFS transporter, FSR family, fosmidomycin resistance protein
MRQPQINYRQPLLWGLLHGFNDCAAGYMLAAYTIRQTTQDAFLLTLLYAIIAFGGQLPVAFMLDQTRSLRSFARSGILLLITATAIYGWSPETGILLSGIASAFIHVTGGAVCLQQPSAGTTPLSLFTAPGVLGLTIGGLLGSTDTPVQWILLGGIVCCALPLWRQTAPKYQPLPANHAPLDNHDTIMLALLLLMSVRSFLFDIVNQLAQVQPAGLVIIGISAFAGKIFGGWLADRVGWKKFIYITLPLALLLFQCAPGNIYAMGFGIACLQSSVPLTLLLLSRNLPRYPATATALSLGTSVALAGLPLYMMATKDTVQHLFVQPGLRMIGFSLLFLLAVWVVHTYTRRFWQRTDYSKRPV